MHYATCSDFGREDGAECRGCAPRACREGSLICDGCFGRARRLLGDLPDMLGRLRSLADPSKATPTDQPRSRSVAVEAPAPVADDLLDAIHAMRVVLRTWDEWGRDLTPMQNQRRTVDWLGAAVLDRHEPVDGIRPWWSVQDATDRWGVERRDRAPRVVDGEDDGELSVTPVAEWGNPIVGRADAEKLAGSASTLRRWVKAGEVEPQGVIYIAGVRVALYRRADLSAARERMEARQSASRAKGRP